MGPPAPGSGYYATRDSYVISEKHDQTAGLRKVWCSDGTMQLDSVIPWATGKSSWRMVPNSATSLLRSFVGSAGMGESYGKFKVAVAAGTAATVSVMVRESVAGDGTDYDGQRIKLYVCANAEAGIASDTLLATATVASEGAFETISGTTAVVAEDCVLSFYVVAGGTGYTGGWINVGAWSATPVADAKGYRFAEVGGPMLWGDNVAAAQSCRYLTWVN